MVKLAERRIKSRKFESAMANETVVQFGASLVGRLAHTDLSVSHGLQPVYEALSNSLHSIEDGSRFEYFEYMSLDKLLDNAEKRNFALFHRLGVIAL